MKILIINESGIEGGGAETRILLLAKELIKTKSFEEIHFISKKKIAISGIISHEATEKTIYEKIKEVIIEYSIDLIQIHNSFDFAARAVKGAREMGKPVIFIAHDYWGFCGRRTLITNKEKVCSGPAIIQCINCIGLLSTLHLSKIKKELNKSSMAIAPSTFVKEIYEKNGILKGKWRVIPPWIDLKIFKPNKIIKRDDKTLLFVGPLTYAKGAVLIAKALKYIVQEIPDIKLRFVGRGQEGGSLEMGRIKKILKKDWTLQNVEFCGSKSGKELAKEYQKATIYLCPPVWPEVFGQTWGQALACGCPVIATNVGSIPELGNKNSLLGAIPDLKVGALRSSLNRKFLVQKSLHPLPKGRGFQLFCKNGLFLVQPENEKELAERILNLLANPPKNSIKHSKKDFFKKFDIDYAFPILKKNYQSLLEKINKT